MLGELIAEGWEWWMPTSGRAAQGPPTIRLDDGEVQLTLDAVRESYYVDAEMDCSTVTLYNLFDTLTMLGFELVDDDEDEPEWLSSGLIRRYLVPTWDERREEIA